MITIFPKGGLGNQLFIFAAGYAVAKSHDCELRINTGWYQVFRERRFELSHFCQNNPQISIAPAKRIISDLIQLPGHMKWRSREIIGSVTHRYQFENASGFDRSILSAKVGTQLMGYFQSWKYFEEFQEEIAHMITNEINFHVHAVPSYAKSIGDNSNDLLVHVRGTDYLQRVNQKIYGALDSQYYERAIEQAQRKGSFPNIKLISDDPTYAREVFNEVNYSVDYSLIDAPQDAWLALGLLSSGSGVVCANSTLSWWAGWVNSQNWGQTFVPDPWFATNSGKESSLLMPQWVRVPRRVRAMGDHETGI